ncbi:MAG: DegT/DnrJ/EryC1/StrS family aminotransferase [Actinomycetota bacterium]
MVSQPDSRTDVVRLAWPDVGEEELAEIREVLESGQLTMGPKTLEFERLLAPLAGTPEAVAVSSGTAALHVAVLALGLGPGDEVLVPAYTFPATGNVVALAGATPVLVDVDPVTMCMDPADAARKVTPRTKAILLVHLFGRPARIEELPEGIPVIEDAAGALGASRGGKPCGSLGALACFSFHPRKIVTTGEGGAITTADPALAEASRSLRHHGWSPSNTYDDMPAPAFNYRISEIEAALGVPQLRRFDELYEAYGRVAAGYTERLRDLVVTPSTDEGDRHGWQAYVIQVDDRDRVMAALRAEGIQCQIGTYALHRLGAYRDAGDFPGADAAFERALALPLHTRLTDSELDRVAEALDKIVSHH